MQTKEEIAEKWMREELTLDMDPFDLAVECAYTLDLCEMCEVNGDKTAIPVWLQKLAEKLIPE